MSAKIFEQIPQVISQAMQMLQTLQPDEQLPVDPNAQALIEQRREAEQMKDAREQQKTQLTLVDKQEERAAETQEHQQTMEFKFMELSSEERQAEIDRATEESTQLAEYAARLEELSIKEGGEDRRKAADLESLEERNAEDNLTALKIAAAEIESGEKVAVSTGTGIDPSG